MIKLDELTESKYPDFETKLYYLRELFEVASFLKLPKEQKNWIENNCTNNVVDFYYDDILFKKKSFTNWKNINGLDDLLQLKKMLQELYSIEPDERIKSAIVQTLSFFVAKEDKSFYRKVYKDIFKFKNIQAGLDTLLSCYDALNNADDNSRFWILKLPSGEFRLMKGRRCIQNCKYSHLSIFKAMKQSNFLHFAQKYYIEVNQFPLENNNGKLYLEYIDATQDKHNLSINDLSIILKLGINDKFFIKEKEVKVITLIRSIMELQKNYIEQIYGDNLSRYKTFSIFITDVTNQEIASLKSMWLKKYKEYGTEIISNIDGSYSGKLDTFELINIFQEFLLHLTIYIESKYGICIKDELKLSNKTFLEILGLKLLFGKHSPNNQPALR